MAKVFYLKDHQERQSSENAALKVAEAQIDESNRVRNLAKQFIFQASSLLNDLDEEDRRVGWLLADCAQLLNAESDLKIVL